MRISDWSSDVCSSELRGWKAAREREIKADFKPRSWEQLGRQAIAAADRIAEKAGLGPILPEAFVNRYYPIRLHRRPQVWNGLVRGEIFRIGNGWSRSEQRRVGKECVGRCGSRW